MHAHQNKLGPCTSLAAFDVANAEHSKLQILLLQMTEVLEFRPNSRVKYNYMIYVSILAGLSLASNTVTPLA